MQHSLYYNKKVQSINFSPPKLNCIIDFAICIPKLLTQSVTTTRILEAFIQAGMIDKKTNQWPDFEKIISTCQRKVKVVEVDLVKKYFTHLYNMFLLEGRISEELFDEIGIVEDRNLDGKVCPCRSLADCHGRAMCLLAESLRQGRFVKHRQAREKKRLKLVDNNTKLSTFHLQAVNFSNEGWYG